MINGSNKEFPSYQVHLFNFIEITCCLICQFLDFKPSAVIAFDGAVCGLFLVYITPITIHLKCLYPQLFCLNKQINNQSTALNINQSIEDSLLSRPLCNDHEILKKKTSSIVRITFYLVILALGIFIFGYSLYELIFQ